MAKSLVLYDEPVLGLWCAFLHLLPALRQVRLVQELCAKPRSLLALHLLLPSPGLGERSRFGPCPSGAHLSIEEIDECV